MSESDHAYITKEPGTLADFMEYIKSLPPKELLKAAQRGIPGLSERDKEMIQLGYNLAQPGGWTLCAPSWVAQLLREERWLKALVAYSSANQGRTEDHLETSKPQAET